MIGAIGFKRVGTHRIGASFPKEKITKEQMMNDSGNRYQKFEEENREWLVDDFIKINEIEPKISWIDFVDKEYARFCNHDFEVNI